MRELGLFAGIGGFSKGLGDAGAAHPVGFVEINPHCQAVLRKHWPHVPIHDDVTTREYVEGEADIITAGFPCQNLSLAGDRTGLAGERSGLYREVVRAIRVVRPVFTLMENVANLLSLGMGRVLGDMAENGLHVEWDCVSSSDVGAPHGRDRIWIAVADANKLQWANGSGETAGWWLRREGEASQTGDSDRMRKLQRPRLLGNVRRWVDNAAYSRAWWPCSWETQFEAFRRMDDGLPDGLDRGEAAEAIKDLGNSLTPQIPQIWGRAILATLQGKDAA